MNKDLKKWSWDKQRKNTFDIANAGYNHLGGEYYRKRVGSIIDEWDLIQYDKENSKIQDIGRRNKSYF